MNAAALSMRNELHSRHFPKRTSNSQTISRLLGWFKFQASEFLLIWTLKTEHSGLQVRWPMEGANMRRRDDGESRSDPRSAWTCQAKQARDDLHGSKGYFLTASRWLGRSPCNARQPGSATAKRGYDVIPQITACNTPGSRRENQPGSRDEIRQMIINMRSKISFLQIHRTKRFKRIWNPVW